MQVYTFLEDSKMCSELMMWIFGSSHDPIFLNILVKLLEHL